MREYSDFERLMKKYGNKLFSTILDEVENRERTVEIMSACCEQYLEYPHRLKTEQDKYRLYLKLCSVNSGRHFHITKRRERLNAYERAKILKSAELYARSGGKAKQRRGELQALMIILAIIAVLLFIEIRFVYSGKFQEGFAAYSEHQEETESYYPSLRTDREE